jgi:glycosyltransferase involved in cell wall biosynthesis
MRVMMTTDALGGVFSYAVDLCRALAKRGVRLTLVALGPRMSADQRKNVTEIEGVELAEHEGALEWMDDPWREVDAANAWLAALSRRVRPDIVHLNGYSQALADVAAPRLVVAHSSVHGWWRAVHGERAPARYDEYARRVKAGLEQADLVVAPTRAMLDSLYAEQGARGRASRVIPNGIELEQWRPAEKLPYFAAAGRLWDQAKNLSLVAGAARELSWPVRVAGDGARDPASKGLELLGRLPRADVARLFASASALLHPACYEPFGLAPLEAARSGCALVLGDIASLREIWGDAALYVPPRDATALREAAARLTTNAALRLELAERARRRAGTYSSQTMARKYLAIYRQIAARRRSSRHAFDEGVMGTSS